MYFILKNNNNLKKRKINKISCKHGIKSSSFYLHRIHLLKSERETPTVFLIIANFNLTSLHLDTFS